MSNRPWSAIQADLKRPLPENAVSVFDEHSGKKAGLSFLHWWVVAEILDEYAPGWTATYSDARMDGDTWTVKCRLHVPTSTGHQAAESWGCARQEYDKQGAARDGYGELPERAERSAFCRAAAILGVGRWLYAKDDAAKNLRAAIRAEKEAIGKSLVGKVSQEAKEAWLASHGTREANAIPASAWKQLHVQALAPSIPPPTPAEAVVMPIAYRGGVESPPSSSSQEEEEKRVIVMQKKSYSPNMSVGSFSGTTREEPKHRYEPEDDGQQHLPIPGDDDIPY